MGVILSAFDLETALRDQLEGRLSTTLGDECRILLADESYWLTPIKDVVDHLERSKIYEISYESEILDCDDFAILLAAEFIKSQWINRRRKTPHAFGQVWGVTPEGGHAINIMVNQDGAVRFVEPQAEPSDSIMTVEECDLTDIRMIRF